MMKILTASDYEKELAQPIRKQQQQEIDAAVETIIADVQARKDTAVASYTEQFDGLKMTNFAVTPEEMAEAIEQVDASLMDALERAHEQIYTFHEAQLEESWYLSKRDNSYVGQKLMPLPSVGIYIPGGKASYPSTVLMNAVPAKIAGVQKIILTTPAQPNGKVHPDVLVAAKIAGVDQIYKVGGAQAIAALAYGTETIEKVVKIVGPGNAYVASAKKQVFGEVAIDMIAGPSEVCIVADASAEPAYVAADLLAQAEHDEMASAICMTTEASLINSLQVEIERQTAQLARQDIIQQSLETNGRIVLVSSLAEAFKLVNKLAPEHLQLMIEQPASQLAQVEHAGAIFLGNYSPEALGDYYAGPNHTLPTSGTAKFSSPLGVYDFMKKSSVIYYTEEALQEVADDIIVIAEHEGLSAHAQSIAIRKERST
ncbi:MAG TPA: histidinol dehydrogenase [Sporosarcina sp.]|nr:histidinol dehydrogenase [Sporosarcina sp.]